MGPLRLSNSSSDGHPAATSLTPNETTLENGEPHHAYRVYKRRFFGLFQLVLLNIIVSWDWLTFAAVSDTAADYFNVSQSAINWLSTGFLFAFVVACPSVIHALNKGSPKTAIVIASILVLVGNWIRYAGTKATGSGRFGAVIVGQIIIGFAQPFVLAIPTRYSQVWFSDSGRVSATALASLANPFGGALGQLIGPLWATDKSGIPALVLYTAVISSAASLPSFLLPGTPPTPPSAHSAAPKLQIRPALKSLATNWPFFQIAIPFAIYVGFFNATSSLLNQIFEPHGFTETEAGIAGAILIVAGLLASAVVSPLIDRTKAYIPAIKLLVPLIAASYLALVFAPQTRSPVAAYIICGLVGAASFALLPTALEFLVELTHPVSPEVSSVVCWAAGQLLGAVFVIIMDALKDDDDDGLVGPGRDQKGDMKRALVFQAVVCWAAVPLPLLLGINPLRRLRLS